MNLRGYLLLGLCALSLSFAATSVAVAKGKPNPYLLELDARWGMEGVSGVTVALVPQSPADQAPSIAKQIEVQVHSYEGAAGWSESHRNVALTTTATGAEVFIPLPDLMLDQQVEVTVKVKSAPRGGMVFLSASTLPQLRPDTMIQDVVMPELIRVGEPAEFIVYVLEEVGEFDVTGTVRLRVATELGPDGTWLSDLIVGETPVTIPAGGMVAVPVTAVIPFAGVMDLRIWIEDTEPQEMDTGNNGGYALIEVLPSNP